VSWQFLRVRFSIECFRSLPMTSRIGPPSLRIGLLLLTATLAVGLVALLSNPGQSELAFFSLSAIAIVTCLIVGNIFPLRSFGVALYVQRPLAVYSAFFFLYYVPVYLLFFVSERTSTHNEARIAVLILLGYLAFWCGLKISLKGPRAQRRPLCLTFNQAKAMLLIAYFGAAMVLVHYAWLISTLGYYYTHTGTFVQPATIVASFAYVFAGTFDLPVVLLLGFLTRVSDVALATRARRFLWFYVSALLFVSVTSSQFRLTVTTLVFVFISLQLGGRRLPKLRYWLLVGGLSATALVVIQAARVIVPSQDIAASDNQIADSSRASLAALRPAMRAARSDIGESVIARAILPMQFLSDIIDATDGVRPHTHGAVALGTIISLVPRALWPQKPTLAPTPIQIERDLGLPELDNSPGPINEFYAEFGLTGVILGYAAFGWLLGFLTEYALNSHGPLGWFILFWLWGAVAVVEMDFVSGVLTGLRQAIVVYLLYRLCLWFVTFKRKQQTVLGSPTTA
jgi:hypothetical protein